MKKAKKKDYLSIEINGFDLDLMLVKFLKEKLGNVQVDYLELMKNKIENKHILNADENTFTVFVEYERLKWK